jgi:hypothetical protein
MFGAYLCFHNRAQSSFGFFIHLHQIFALITSLSIPGFWSPRPPLSLGLQSFSQLTKAHLLSDFNPRQRNFLLMFLMVLITDLGAAKAKKRYFGIACRTNFTRTNRPTRLRVQKVEEFSRRASESKRQDQEIFLAIESKSGRPR